MDYKIVAVIIVVLLIVMGAAYVLGTQNSNTPVVAVNNTTNATKDISKVTHDHSTHKNNSNQTNTTVKISATQAQKIAVGAAEELGGEKVKAGTPVLFKWTQNKLHTWAWDVPLFYVANGTDAGGLYVDAMTGEVIMNE